MAQGSKQKSDASSHHRGLSPFECTCFTLNYLIGTGFLVLPWAFQRAGIILSAIAMSMICFIANLSSDYILSSMARAEAITENMRDEDTSGDKRKMPPKKGEVTPPCDRHADEKTALLIESNTSQSNVASTSHPPPSLDVESSNRSSSDSKQRDNRIFHNDRKSSGRPPSPTTNSSSKKNESKFPMDVNHTTAFSSDSSSSSSSKPLLLLPTESANRNNDSNNRLLVKTRKFELTELCAMFLGEVGFRAYAVAVALDIYGFLWAYTSVFGNAMSKAVPLFGPTMDSYPIYVIIFAAIVVPLSILEFSEQVAVQVFQTGCRVLMIFIMVVTPLAAVFFVESGGDDEDGSSSVPHFDDQIEPEGAALVRFSNIHQMIPAVVFSVLYHQSIPSLTDEVTDKTKMGSIFAVAFLICGTAYSLVGIVDAWFFGSGIFESSNLNWEVYHGGTGRSVENQVTGGQQWVGVSWWAKAVSYYVVCFPALDVISPFPLNAFVLGNSFIDIFYRGNTREVQDNRRIKTVYRLLAAVPPIIGALFVRDLGTITDYSGLTGLAIAFCFPSLLYIVSLEKSKDLDIQSQTYYERIGSSVGSAWAMFAFGVISIVYCFTLLVTRG